VPGLKAQVDYNLAEKDSIVTKNGKPVKNYWGATVILCAFVAFLLVQGLMGVILTVQLMSTEGITALQGPEGVELITKASAAPLFLITAQLSMYLIWLSYMWWVTKYRSGVQLGKKFWNAFKDNFWIKFKKRDLLIGLGIAVVMMGFQLLVLNGLPAIFPNLNMEGAGNTDVFAALDGVWFFIIAFGIGSVIGPICEELFFRGFVMRGILNHFSFSDTHNKRNIDILEDEAAKKSSGVKTLIMSYRAWGNKNKHILAIVISSILFGFMHFQGFETFGQWLVVIVTGSLGLVLAIVTYKLKRIAPAMVAHVLYNSISFGLLLLELNA
jgi:membrane protease YdiL (CAAX protease family)